MTKSIFDFVQLPFLFSEKKLIKDLEHCTHSNWASHFNKNDFAGNWEIISLRSKTGKETDINAFSNNKYLDTPLMEQCQYFKEIVNSFLCEKEAVRLMNLRPKSEIKTHTDNAGGYADGFCRIHIPIITNGKVHFVVNGNQIPMKVGEAWYANFSQPHSVKNEGETDRIHLVIDCIRNSWTDNLFDKLGYNFEAEKQQTYSKENLLLMIENLKLMKTETADLMIKNFENELAKLS